MKVRVISLWQPWASLIVSGAKKIETRSWYPRELRPGSLLAIHAAKHWTDEERGLCEEDPFFRRYLTTAQRRGLWDFDHPPLGGIVGLVTYEGAKLTQELVRAGLTEREHTFGNYGWGRFGWLLSDPRPLPFTSLRGQQGIFAWEMEGNQP